MRARALFLVAAALVGCGTPRTTSEDPEDAGLELDGGLDLPDAGSPADAGEQDAGVPLVNGSAFVSQAIPSSVKAGASFEVSVTMRNTGTTTWALASSQGHFLGSEGPRDNETWGTSRIFMQDGVRVGPGESYTFTRSVTAPADAGSYPMQWQMLQDAVEWFGEVTPRVDVTVERVGAPPGSTPKEIVTYYRSLYGTPMTASEILTCLRQIAVELNSQGIAGGPFGVLVKTGGHNCLGYSCDIICSGQGSQQRQWDVLVAVETVAEPAWNEVSNIAVRPCEIQ